MLWIPTLTEGGDDPDLIYLTSAETSTFLQLPIRKLGVRLRFTRVAAEHLDCGEIATLSSRRALPREEKDMVLQALLLQQKLPTGAGALEEYRSTAAGGLQ